MKDSACLGHVDVADLPAVAAASDRKIECRGVHLDAARLAAILGAFRRESASWRWQLGDVDFDGAVFTESASFYGYDFLGRAWFRGARFEGEATFAASSFTHSPHFEKAVFVSEAVFGSRGESAVAATFQRRANFEDAEFHRLAVFERVEFGLTARFERVQFHDGATFEGAAFNGWADFEDMNGADTPAAAATSFGPYRLSFEHARFGGTASFGGARLNTSGFDKAEFVQLADFHSTSFIGEAVFDGVTFRGRAVFSDLEEGRGRTNFQGKASFRRAVFDDVVWFADTRFEDAADFSRATFRGDYNFTRVNFASEARFDLATFEGEPPLGFEGVRCGGLLSFYRATIDRSRRFGPMVVDHLSLDEAIFTSPVRFDAAARVVTAVGTQARRGLDLRLRWADVVLEDIDLSVSSSVTGAGPFDQLDENELATFLETRYRSSDTRIVSLRGADVSALVLADVDVRFCRFMRAYNLHKLRFDGDVGFAPSPPSRWRTTRQVIAEEHHWRAVQQRGDGWWSPPTQPGDTPSTPPEILQPAEIAAIYRSLRQGREEARDEPGAADFYYGEMEARRSRRDTPAAERLILTLYWLVSGYGLRASRALAALAVTVALFSVLLCKFGFPQDTEYLDALVFTLSSTTSLFRSPAADLTRAGSLLELGLRLLGPLFFGLVVLSLRGRVKR